MARLFLNVFVLLCALASLGLVDAAPKVLSMRMYRQERNTLQKRASFSVTLGNAFTYGLYYVNATVGTPPQEVQLQIDTGSSDVWMFGPNSCDSSTSPCLGGAFDPSSSSSLTVVGQGQFKIAYVTPGSGVTGDYVQDDFTIGGMTIPALTMGVATQAAYVSTGIMGIGFDTDESIVSAGGTPYPNIIDVMVQQKIINSRAYSLWLDNLEDATGTALFGGYDTEKYSGDLTILAIQPDSQSGAITSMTVAWTSLSLTDSSGTTQLIPTDFPLATVLDSGTTLTVMPPDIWTTLATYFGAINDPQDGPVVACDIGTATGSLDFGFGGSGGTTISVSFSELAIPLYDTQGNPLTFEDGSAACQFGLSPATDGEPILFGDTFLRSAYVVYDLDNQEIGIAPTVFESKGSNVVEIGTGNVGNGQVDSSVTVKQTATGAGLAPGVEKPTGTNIATTVQTGIRGVKTTSSAAATASAKSSKAAAPKVVPAFNFVGGLAVGSYIVVMVLGGAFVVFG